jgi:Polyketide cyclase / dehydrase and lipid transport
MTERLSVERAIAAEPAAIFDVLRRPDGHVAIDASGMLMSASGQPVDAVGDRFDVHMDRESLQDYPLGEYTVSVVIARYEPDRAIAWTIDGVAQPPIGHVYGYELEPIEGGTMVTSYYDWSDIHESYRASAATIFPVISEKNLRATLGILARTVAPGRGRPGATQTVKGGLDVRTTDKESG